MDPIYHTNLSLPPAANEESNDSIEQPQQAATAYADLSYKHIPRGHSLNNPPPDTWAYPHNKGIGTGSNLESFKEEIAARTQKGENCKAIAEALNAMGVQTSDRAVSRVRIKWGMRKRAQRKVKTPPPGSDAAHLSAKSRVQALRKAELIRMTREGMTAEEIYRNLTARGMELKKGVATVLRLQSAWGLAHDEKRWLGNFRHQCHKKAKAQQVDAFSEIAKELGVQDTEAWMREKMSEEAARQARHERALKLMGEHAPTNPERRKLQTPRRTDGLYTEQALDLKTSGPGAEPHQNDDRSSPEAGDGVAITEPSHQSGIEMDMDDDYIPLNEQEDEDTSEFEGGNDEAEGFARASTLALEHATNVSRTVPSQLVPWPDSQQPSTATASSVSSPSRSTMQTSRSMVERVAGPSFRSPVADVTPNNRGKARPMRQSAAKSAPKFALEAPTRRRQTDIAPTPQISTQPLTSPVQSAGRATTSATYTTTRNATATAMAQSVPQLVLRTEEAEANKSTLSALDQYEAAAKAYKELLEARNENKPLPGSLTGLPPSAKEVDTAKRKLKEVTQAMMLALD